MWSCGHIIKIFIFYLYTICIRRKLHRRRGEGEKYDIYYIEEEEQQEKKNKNLKKYILYI